MFDRAFKDACFVPRWSIVRKLRQQNVGEHSWLVTMYANDIAHYFNYPVELIALTLRTALWHDAKDEIVSGDFPGPNKRMLVSDREAWDAGCEKATWTIFGGGYKARAEFDNGNMPGSFWSIAKQTVKVADWLESAIEDATELQLGNDNHLAHFIHDSRETLVAAKKLCEGLTTFSDQIYGKPLDFAISGVWSEFRTKILAAIRDARYGQSPGPVMAPEMYAAAMDAKQLRNRRGDDMHMIVRDGL